MKKLVSLLAILLLCATSLFAQAPEKFSYQAVVRNSSNSLVTDAQVGVRVSILQGSADGSAVYVETQTATTNANGLLTIEIGGGKAEQGEFAGIDWVNGPYFLKTETDPNGGSNYTVTSTQQLLSVPYALYSREAGNGFSGDYNDLKNKPAIPQNVGELANDAGYITMSDLPHSPKGGGTDDAGVVQTTVCGEIDLCQMAAQLAQMEQRWAVLLPTVITKAVSNVTETTATCGGIVTAAGYDEVTARGVCLGTEPNPMVDGNHTSNGTGTGSFTTDLDNLMPSTTYYVRAYAINSIDTAYGEEMSFTTAEEIPLDTCGTLTLPYSENFDSFTTSTTTLTGVEPTCWKLVHEDVQMSDETRPQICYSNSYAYSGDYSLRLHYRGIYAMPKLPENIEMNNVTLEMSLKQPKKYYALEVGVWEDSGTFVPVATFNNSTTSYKRVECDFSEYTGNGRRIAFRNIPGSNEIYNYSYNFIDDIVLNYTAPACPGTPTVTDVDGNVYNTVLIGSQCWMKENLRTTKYADGTAIPAGGSTTSNTDPYYYDYSSSSIPLEERGYLYNWAAAMHGATSSNAVPSGVQGICPNGWHLPSDAEWTALEQTQTTLSVTGTGWRGDHAGRLAGGDRWNSSSNGSTPGNMSYVARNASGFEAVPAGDCSGSSFYGMGSSAFFWTSTRYSSSNSHYRRLSYDNASVYHYYGFKNCGFSVRCLRVEGVAIAIDAKSCSSTPTVTDHEGNVYATVKIGEQCWMRDNLRTTTSPSTGTYLIPAAGTGYTYTGKQARWYNNDSVTYAPMNYGLLYNWNAAVDTFNTAYGETSVNTSSSNAVSVTFSGHRRGICPVGWHLPSDAEWTVMTDYVSSQSEYVCEGNTNHIAKALADSIRWNSSSMSTCDIGNNRSANNATGFSAVPAGRFIGSEINGSGYVASFWSSTQYSIDRPSDAHHRYLYYYYPSVYRSSNGKHIGYSVRCLRD